MLEVALEGARAGLAEGGIPIGAAVFGADGRLISSGHNRRVQESDPSAHGETDTFRRAGRQKSYRKLTMVTTLAPCWYCSGLIRQFGFGRVIVGESETFQGGIDWLRGAGVGGLPGVAGGVYSRASGGLERGYWGGVIVVLEWVYNTAASKIRRWLQ